MLFRISLLSIWLCHLHVTQIKVSKKAWLAPSVEHATLDLGILSLSPTMDVIKINKNKKSRITYSQPLR